MIEVSSLRFETPDFSLGPLDFQIEEGAYCVLLGPSGSGKTSIVEWMGGFRKARSGSLRIHGTDVSRLAPEQRDLALVFQEAALFPHLSVEENIAFPLRLAGETKASRKALATEMAERFQISHRLNASPQTLSGGEAQRVALARSLVRPSSVLLLDEPLASVDPALHRELILLLKETQKRLPLTVLHVTHSLVEARNLATHLGVLGRGQLRQYGRSETILESPCDETTAKLVGLQNFLSGHVDEHTGGFRCDDGTHLPTSEYTGEGSHGELSGLELAKAKPPGPCLPCSLESVEISAEGRRRAHVQLAEGGPKLTIPIHRTREEFAPGDVWLDFSEAKVRLF